MTKVFFTSDVHGSEACFVKFFNAANFYKAESLILGGDVTGKMIIPIVEQGDGTYYTEYLGKLQILKTNVQREAVEKRIRTNGYYPYEPSPSEVEELQNDREKLDRVYTKVMMEGVKRWVAIAEGKLKDKRVKCYIGPGNDDRFEIDDILKSSSARS